MSTNNNQPLSEGSKEEVNFVSDKSINELLSNVGHLMDRVHNTQNAEEILHVLFWSKMISFVDLLKLEQTTEELLDLALSNE